MWNALAHAGDDKLYRFWTIPDNSNHAFGYWSDPIHDVAPPLNTQNINFTVKERVIGYFKQYLPFP